MLYLLAPPSEKLKFKKIEQEEIFSFFFIDQSKLIAINSILFIFLTRFSLAHLIRFIIKYNIFYLVICDTAIEIIQGPMFEETIFMQIREFPGWYCIRSHLLTKALTVERNFPL